MLEFAERNGLTWRPLDDDDVVDTMLAVAAGSMSEADFVDVGLSTARIALHRSLPAEQCPTLPYTRRSHGTDPAAAPRR